MGNVLAVSICCKRMQIRCLVEQNNESGDMLFIENYNDIFSTADNITDFISFHSTSTSILGISWSSASSK